MILVVMLTSFIRHELGDMGLAEEELEDAMSSLYMFVEMRIGIIYKRLN